MASSAPFAAANLFSCKGWTALVTGGGTGIGLMCAQALASNGARVYITGRRQEKLDTAVEAHGTKDKLGDAGGELVALQMDVNSKESILKAYETIAAKEKHLNVLVNNAGIASRKLDLTKREKGVEALSKSMFDYPEDQWGSVFQTNVFADYYVTAAFLPLLKKAPTGSSTQQGVPLASIINIASISGTIKQSQGGQFAYNSSKAAARHLTNLMAYEFSRDDVLVRVNSICPGYFPSEMTTNESSDRDNKSELKADGETFRNDKGVPAGRMGHDFEMARLCLDLATNTYIYGQNINIDGGLLLNWASDA